MNIVLGHWRRLAVLTILLAAPGCGSESTTLPEADAAPTSDAEGADASAPDGDVTTPDATLPSDGPPSDGGALYGESPFSIILLPDTQFYVQSYPEMFTSQTAWIVEQKTALGLAFVLHMGDVVETPSLAAEWMRASTALTALDTAKIPYVLSAGNHDIDLKTRKAPLLNQTFPASRFNPYLQGTYEPGEVQNSYYLLPAGGRSWLVVVLEFGPRNEVLAWADSIFKMHADKPAILLTHAYMYLGKQRYDHINFPDPKQFWNPHGYLLPGTTNDGEEMWQKLVSKNDNILFSFSGHATWPEGAAGLISTRRASGYYVHEMLANYQGCPSDYMCVNRDTKKPVRGGEGMLRILRMDPANKRARVETFSPFLKMSRAETEHQFELPLE